MNTNPANVILIASIETLVLVIAVTPETSTDIFAGPDITAAVVNAWLVTR